MAAISLAEIIVNIKLFVTIRGFKGLNRLQSLIVL